jgi:hypothetical protein
MALKEKKFELIPGTSKSTSGKKLVEYSHPLQGKGEHRSYVAGVINMMFCYTYSIYGLFSKTELF